MISEMEVDPAMSCPIEEVAGGCIRFGAKQKAATGKVRSFEKNPKG
jgi:hypothetical protein